MGELKNLAKKQSKFLKIEVDEAVVVKYLDYKVLPSSYDPEKETVQYKFEVDGTVKFWTNGSGFVMSAFDEIPRGEMVKIYREKMKDTNGNIVAGKSIYSVIPVKEEKTAWEEEDDK